MIKMKGTLVRIYSRDQDDVKAYVYQHANRTVRYILSDSNKPSNTGTIFHMEKLLNNQGFNKFEEVSELLPIKLQSHMITRKEMNKKIAAERDGEKDATKEND